MKIDRVELGELTEADLDYIWNNLRDYDREELKIQGCTDKNYKKLLKYERAYCGKYEGVPVCAFGANPNGLVVNIWFIATVNIYQHMRLFHKFAPVFCDQVAREYVGQDVIVEVWEGHKVSLSWLERIGFERTKYVFEENEERIILMKWRGNNVYIRSGRFGAVGGRNTVLSKE